jgi:hypothetical protein
MTPIIGFYSTAPPVFWPHDEFNDFIKANFVFSFVVVIILAAVLAANSLVYSFVDAAPGSLAYDVLAMLGMLVAFSGLFLLPWRAHREWTKQARAPPPDVRTDFPVSDSSMRTGLLQGEAEDARSPKPIIDELTWLQCLLNPDFLMIYFMNMTAIGTALLFVNNIAQIIAALKGKDSDKLMFLTAFSVASTLGRIGAGYLSDRLAGRVNRPVMTVVSTLGIGVCSLVASFSSLYPTLILFFLIGLFDGAMFAVVPSGVGELFGIRKYGANYALIQSAILTGGATLSLGVMPYFYSKANTSASSDADNCVGLPCFGPTFLIEGLACIISALVGILLVVRTRPAYRMHYGSGSPQN